MLEKEQYARDPFAKALQLFVLHILLASIGMLTRGENQPAAIIAPAPAALLAFLLMRPVREWGYYCIAAFAAEMAFDKVVYHVSVAAQTGFATANVLEGLSAACVLRFGLQDRLNLARTQHSTIFMIAVGLVGPAVGAVVGAYTLHQSLDEAFWMGAQRWWFGDAITHFTVTPAILMTWELSMTLRQITRRQVTNAAVFVFVMTAALAVSPLFTSVPMPLEFALLSLPLVLWLASRERLVVLCLANSIGTILSLILLSEFRLTEATNHEVIEIQLFLAIVSATVLLTGALFEERLLALNAVEGKRVREQRSAQANKLQALGLLTGGIAHDINNLLGLIDLRLELAKKGLTERSPQMVQILSASEAVQRGAKLVRRLLVFSRSEPLNAELYDLNDVLSNLVGLLRKAVGIETTLAFFPARASLMCAADGAELEAAVVNLIVNARDALGGSGVIQVMLSQVLIDGAENLDSTGAILQPGNYARISVSDNGCGMSPEILRQCFDPFFTTKNLNNGTGLGLSTIVGFVHQVGGGIYVDSELHKGTDVKLLLPLSPKADEPTASSEALRTELSQKTILIVEDNGDLRDALASLLRQKGLNVEEASSGPAAEDKLKASPHIALVLSDVMMPGGMTGVELLQKVQNKSPHIKLLLMTGYAGNALANVSAADCAFEVVRKPFDFEDLASRIGQLLKE